VLGISVLLRRCRHGGRRRCQAAGGFSLFVTSIVFGVATISNDNLQDLKTGELVGATPWRSRSRWCWAWCSARW
jgi:uncharacterized oligopeptide transporter (OPT) family protein